MAEDKKEKTRFSDAELAEFTELIQHKIKEAKIDLELLNNELSHKDNHGTDDTSRSFNMMEDGASTFSREMTAQKAARQEKFIVGLENALYILSDCLTKEESILSKMGLISSGNTLVSLKKFTRVSDCSSFYRNTYHFINAIFGNLSATAFSLSYYGRS